MFEVGKRKERNAHWDGLNFTKVKQNNNEVEFPETPVSFSLFGEH